MRSSRGSRIASVSATTGLVGEEPSQGWPVFSRRTAGNGAYRPTADPLQMVQASVPARSSRVLTSAVPIFEPPVLLFGRKTAFLRGRIGRIVSSAFSMVGAQADSKRHSQPAAVPRGNRPQHATVEQRFGVLSQASCCPAPTEHTHDSHAKPQSMSPWP